MSVNKFYYIQLSGKNKKSDPVFVVHDNKIIGTTSDDDHVINRLTYDNIENHPELWFLIDKGEHYLYYSHKSSILNNILSKDLFYYICDY